ncbi:CPBP family intramembrane glutamic endopeptidase [Latilactobacillus sakei]|uniref:CPBP family intramembrane glutamic endopeptidase n=1 Tax=Latilactobacillus sakei TaxID=1599 RepID=UPI002030CD5F|nr:CPBP family intramembrane glutamic endopeptidase [Latilactobacillus sakei]MCM1636676.1 CPBP family intramembrane metalloprotease [Latilactobacillus sakei]
MDLNKKASSAKRLIIFILITTIFLIVISTSFIKDTNPVYIRDTHPTCLILLMITPTISVLLTKIITKETLKDPMLLPNIKKNKKNYALSYLIIPLIAYSGAVIFFILFPHTFNPLLSKFAFQYHLYTIKEYLKSVFFIIPACLLINPLGGLLSCFGEEYAWRGYLLTNLCNIFSKKTSIILTGLIWGLWHAPIIYTGYNYGTDHKFLGILMMIIFCSTMNIILSYSLFKTKTIWIPVVIHASINGIDKYTPVYMFGSRFIKYNYFIGPNLVGLIGGSGLFVLAILFYVKINK